MDHDSNASTPCSDCSPGKYAPAERNKTHCSECPAGRASEDSGADGLSSCSLIGISKEAMGALLAVPVLLAVSAAIWVLMKLAVSIRSARQSCRRRAGKTRTRRRIRYGDGATSNPTVPKSPSWLQNLLLLMKRVDTTIVQSTEAQAEDEGLPDHPRPSARPLGVKSGVDQTPADAELARAVAQFEKVASGATVGQKRHTVALSVAAHRLRPEETPAPVRVPTFKPASDYQRERQRFAQARSAAKQDPRAQRSNPALTDTAASTRGVRLPGRVEASTPQPFRAPLLPSKRRLQALDKSVQLAAETKLLGLSAEMQPKAGPEPTNPDWEESDCKARLVTLGNSDACLSQLSREDLRAGNMPAAEAARLMTALRARDARKDTADLALDVGSTFSQLVLERRASTLENRVSGST